MSSLWKSLLPKPATRQHGATRRHDVNDDRWLNRLLDIAVLSALVVGSAALVVMLFLD